MKLTELDCRAVRLDLSVGGPETLTSDEREHLESCPECARYLAGMREIDRAIGALGTEGAPPPLRDRIARKLEPADRGAWPSRTGGARPWRLALAGLACVALTLGFGVHFRGGHHAGLQFYTGEAASAMEHVDSAVAAVRTAHFVTYMTDYETDNDTVLHHFETPQKVEEQWYEDRKWRKEGVWGSRLIIGHPIAYDAAGRPAYGTYYRYDSAKRAVISMTESGEQREDFSLESVLGFTNPRDRYDAETVWSGMSQGRMIHEVKIVVPGQPRERTFCWIDDAKNLPISVQEEGLNNGVWSIRVRTDFDFNRDLPASLFDPSTLMNEGWSMQGR